MTTIEITVPALPANRKIHAIMAKTLENLACLFHDCEDDIQASLAEGVENVTISHSIVLNLGKNKQTDKLSVSIKRGDEITCTIPDPDQPDLFSHDNPTVRAVNPAEPTTGASLMGLPAPIQGIAMIEAEVIDVADEDNEQEGGEEE